MFSVHTPASKAASKTSVLRRFAHKAKSESNTSKVVGPKTPARFTTPGIVSDGDHQASNFTDLAPPAMFSKLVAAIGEEFKSSLCTASELLPFDFRSSTFKPGAKVDLKSLDSAPMTGIEKPQAHVTKASIFRKFFWKRRLVELPKPIMLPPEDWDKPTRRDYRTIRQGTKVRFPPQEIVLPPSCLPNSCVSESGETYINGSVVSVESWTRFSPVNDTYPPYIVHHKRYSIPMEKCPDIIPSETLTASATLLPFRLASLFDENYLDFQEKGSSSETSDGTSTNNQVDSAKETSTFATEASLVSRKRNGKVATFASELAIFEFSVDRNSFAARATS